MRYRDQWNTISSPTFRTTLAEAEYKLYGSSLDSWHVGLLLLNDQSNGGLLKQNSVALAFAYTRKLVATRTSYHEVSFGSAGGFTRTNTDTQALWFSRQYDQANLQIDRGMSNGETMFLENTTRFSLDLGFRWDYKIDKENRLTIGLAIAHLNGPSNAFIDQSTVLNQRRFLGINYERASRNSLRHRIHLNILSQSPSVQILPGYKLILDFIDDGNISMEFGLGTRIANSVDGYINDAVLVSFALRAERWMTRFAYEANTSGLTLISRSTGTLELALEYYIRPAY